MPDGDGEKLHELDIQRPAARLTFHPHHSQAPRSSLRIPLSAHPNAQRQIGAASQGLVPFFPRSLHPSTPHLVLRARPGKIALAIRDSIIPAPLATNGSPMCAAASVVRPREVGSGLPPGPRGKPRCKGGHGWGTRELRPTAVRRPGPSVRPSTFPQLHTAADGVEAAVAVLCVPRAATDRCGLSPWSPCPFLPALPQARGETDRDGS